MKQYMIRVGGVLLCLAAVACGGEPEPTAPAVAETPQNTPATEPPEAPEPAEQAAVATEATVPVAEDFEEEMSQAVTADNYRAELDAVLAELEAN